MRRLTMIAQSELFQADERMEIRMKLCFDDATEETVILATSDLPDCTSYFLALNQILENAGHVAPIDANTDIQGPFTVHAAGLSLGTAADDSGLVLVFDLAGVRLGLEMPNNKLAELLSAAGPIVSAASVPRSKKPN